MQLPVATNMVNLGSCSLHIAATERAQILLHQIEWCYSEMPFIKYILTKMKNFKNILKKKAQIIKRCKGGLFLKKIRMEKTFNF